MIKAKEWVEKNKGKFPPKVRTFWDPNMAEGKGGTVDILVDNFDMLNNPMAMSGMSTESLQDLFLEVLELALKEKV